MMPKKELENLLDELAGQLEQDDQLDADELAALGELHARIGGVLAEDSARQEDAGQGVNEPLAELVDRFETTHPTLTMTLGRIMDALNKLGI
jgi:hypothetical protein